MRGWKASLTVAAIAVMVALNAVVLIRLRELGPPPRIPAAAPAAVDTRPIVRVGVISRYSPSLSYDRYQPVLDYLTERGSYRYELRLSTSYEDAAQQLLRGEVVATFFGTWIYASLGPRLGLEPVLAPRNEAGGTTFHAALVVPNGSSIATVRDLSGRRVALPSRSSFAGNWLAAEALPRAGLTLADLDSVHHFDYHQTVVHRVLDGQFDAGVVREAVAREFESEGLRVVARSGDFPGPPLVIRAGSSHPAIAEIRRLLLELDPQSADGAARTRGWGPEFAHGFTPVDTAVYGTVIHATRRGGTP